jgi:hypothetical protein
VPRFESQFVLHLLDKRCIPNGNGFAPVSRARELTRERFFDPSLMGSLKLFYVGESALLTVSGFATLIVRRFLSTARKRSETSK